MRTAAGILMIIAGALVLLFAASLLSDYAIYGGDFALGVIAAILAAFSITGGVFCLERKYWKICLASASLLFILSAFALSFWVSFWLSPAPEVPGALVSTPPPVFLLMVMGIPPLAFVCLRKREWEEQGSLQD